MKKFTQLGLIAIWTMMAGPAPAAGPRVPEGVCALDLTDAIPARTRRAPTGSALIRTLIGVGGSARDAALEEQVLLGNVPAFLRTLVPVTLRGRAAGGRDVDVTICVTPDYLAVGDDRDFVRVPMGLPAAARIAARLGFFLPTPNMVDAIYTQARVHLDPAPMKPTNEMSSTRYFFDHDRTVARQRAARSPDLGLLTAGQKKDIVLSPRLRAKPGRVAIYGWHRSNGRPIQPLSTVHGASYADYSHGVRLISGLAFVDGKPRLLAEIMQDPVLGAILSRDGPIRNPAELLASLFD